MSPLQADEIFACLEETANRPKDRRVLPVLRRLLEKIRKRERI